MSDSKIEETVQEEPKTVETLPQKFDSVILLTELVKRFYDLPPSSYVYLVKLFDQFFRNILFKDAELCNQQYSNMHLCLSIILTNIFVFKIERFDSLDYVSLCRISPEKISNKRDSLTSKVWCTSLIDKQTAITYFSYIPKLLETVTTLCNLPNQTLGQLNMSVNQFFEKSSHDIHFEALINSILETIFVFKSQTDTASEFV